MRQNRDQSDLFLSSGAWKPFLSEREGRRAVAGLLLSARRSQGSSGVPYVCLPAEGTVVFFNAASRACCLHRPICLCPQESYLALSLSPWAQSSEGRRGKERKAVSPLGADGWREYSAPLSHPPRTYPCQTGIPGGLRRKMFEAPPLPSMRKGSPNSLPTLVGHFLIVFPRKVEPTPLPRKRLVHMFPLQ